MAAGILAQSLGLDLYKIDLSSVVSKYIGETEKNLSQIFDEASTANVILFFDEADALFGKRSEVKDAHDRYANIEISYLLQKMEEYEGVAILATNLSQNLDEAFSRRMQFVIDFPFPAVADRARIWRALFPPQAPRAEDIDVEFLARQFELAGGDIKNCVLAAAFLAAEEGTAMSMAHLIQGVVREYGKIGRPLTRSSFGNYFQLARQRS
jgi:SpoVK/Ycf46/Vps4 family AAA+-type ATPase